MYLKNGIQRYREVMGYFQHMLFIERKDEKIKKGSVEVEFYDAIPPIRPALEPHKGQKVDEYA